MFLAVIFSWVKVCQVRQFSYNSIKIKVLSFDALQKSASKVRQVRQFLAFFSYIIINIIANQVRPKSKRPPGHSNHRKNSGRIARTFASGRPCFA